MFQCFFCRASLLSSEICKLKLLFIRFCHKAASNQPLLDFLVLLLRIFSFPHGFWVTVYDFKRGRLNPRCHKLELYFLSYQILSVGGGGTLTTRVPDSSCTSTVSSRGVLDISSNFFLMNSFSVALWKYLDLAILSTNLKIFFPVFPPPALQRGKRIKEAGRPNASVWCKYIRAQMMKVKNLPGDKEPEM